MPPTVTFEVSLADERLDDAIEKLSLIHKRSIAKDGLERQWERMSALCAGSIGKAIFHENVLKVVRREVRRECDVLIDPEDLAVAVHELFSQEAREEMGPLRIRKRRKVLRTPDAKSAPATTIEAAKSSKPNMATANKRHAVESTDGRR